MKFYLYLIISMGAISLLGFYVYRLKKTISDIIRAYLEKHHMLKTKMVFKKLNHLVDESISYLYKEGFEEIAKIVEDGDITLAELDKSISAIFEDVIGGLTDNDMKIINKEPGSITNIVKKIITKKVMKFIAK